MRVAAASLLAIGVLMAGASAATVSPPAAGHRACSPLPCGPIKHIIIMVRENHSFDNLFGRFPGADGTKFARV